MKRERKQHSGGQSACYIQSICRAAHRFLDPDAAIRDSQWVLDYFYDDGLRFRIGSESAPWQIRPGRSVCIYRPGTVRWQNSIACKERIRGAWAVFLPTADSRMDELVPPGNNLALFDDRTGIVGKVFDTLNSMVETQPPVRSNHRDLRIVDIVLDILRHAAHAPSGIRRIDELPKGIDGRLLVTKVDFFLRHNFSSGIGRSDLARVAGLTEAHLSRSYAQQTGTTPMKSLVNLRTHAAARMLEHGLPIKEVAARTGFCDTSHFMRVFKSSLGCSPGDFKKKLDTSDAEAYTDLPGSWDYHRSTVTLAGTTRLSRNTLDPRQRNENDSFWVLDAFLSTGVRMKALDADEPWMTEEPGWLRLYSPRCPYWEDGTNANRPIVSFSLSFIALPSSSIAIKYGTGPVCIRFHDPNHRIITRLQQLAFMQDQSEEIRMRESEHVFHKLIIRLTRAQQIGPNSFLVVERPSANPLVANVTTFLEAHFHEALTREQIAAHAGASVSTLAHTFAAETGEGPMKTLQKIRIRHARVLLSQGMPVAKVAERVGFEDATVFSKVFRRSDRMSPLQHQKLSRG